MSVSFTKLQRDLSRGMEKLTWMARFLADRTKKETLLVRAAYDVRQIEDRMEDAYRRAGERLFAVRHEERPAADFELEEILKEIEGLAAELDDRMSHVRTMEGNFEDEPDGPGVEESSTDRAPE